MYHKILKYSTILCIGLVLSGCQQITENMKNSPDSLSPEKVAQIYNQEQLGLAINEHLESLEQVSASIKSTFTYGDKELIKTQNNFEAYKDLNLDRLEISTQVSNDDQTLKENFVLDKEGYHSQVNGLPFQTKESATRQPFIYINFLNYLTQATDPWNIEEIDENTMNVTVDLTDPELTKKVGDFLDIPIIVSPDVQYTFSLNYQVDKKLGVIKSGVIDGTIHDLNQDFKIRYELTNTAVNDKATALNIDLNEEAINEEDDFIKQFKAMNPTNLITNYEMRAVRTKDNEELQSTYFTQNTLQTTPYFILESDIIDEKLSDFKATFNGKRYALDGDKVVEEDAVMFNPYHHYVEQFIKSYDKLELMEEETDAEGESEEGTEAEAEAETEATAETEAETGAETDAGNAAETDAEKDTESTEKDSNAASNERLNYRQAFETSLDDLKAVSGSTNIDQFNSGEGNFYGIEYFVDKKTHRLVSVVVWNGTEGDEMIDTTSGYFFDNINSFNPNLLGNQVNEKIWQQMNK